MESGTGQSITDAVVTVIDKWQLPLKSNIGISWDTTSSNTVGQKESATLVEVY